MGPCDDVRVAVQATLDRKDNTERENAVRRDEHFVVGEKVLFYNRLVGDEQDPSKLQLRTALYEVKEVKGGIYTLALCESPDVERRAHVMHLRLSPTCLFVLSHWLLGGQ